MSLYADVLRYRDLFGNLFRRELYTKYRGSVLGLGWTLINPIVLVLVYWVVFSVLLRALEIEHFPLFVLTGIALWVFFQSAVQMSAASLFGHANLVKQVRFPRHLIPLSVVAANLVTLLVMLVVVLVANLVFIPETRSTFWAGLPLFVPLVAVSSGLSLAFAAITALFRDIEHLLATIFLPWFFLTPIFYTFDILPGIEGHERLVDVLYYGNFMAPVIEAIRDPIFFGRMPDLVDALYAVVAGAAALGLGALVFRRMDDQLAAQL